MDSYFSKKFLGELHELLEGSKFRVGMTLGVEPLVCHAKSLDSFNLYRSFPLGYQGVFAAASTIKIPILLNLFRCFSFGLCSPDDRHTVTQEEIVPYGVLPWCGAGRDFTLMELAQLMIIFSCNTSTNILIDILGMSKVNAMLRDLGLTNTVLRRKMMQPASVNGENTTTPDEMVELMHLISSGTALEDPWRSQLLDIMHNQQFIEKIPHRLPEDAWVANKVGELDGMRHDVAMVCKGSNTFYLAVFTDGVKEAWKADDLIAELARRCYEELPEILPEI